MLTSPLLGNVYLHHALDLWFAEEVRPLLRGKGVFVRYADDGCFGFERRDDAQRVMAVLGKRMERFVSSRQGCNSAGESPAAPVARVRREAIPRPGAGNRSRRWRGVHGPAAVEA